MAFPVSVSLTCWTCAVLRAPWGCVQEQPRSLAGLTATAVGAPCVSHGDTGSIKGASGQLRPCGCACHGVCPACSAGSPGDGAGKSKVVKFLQAKFFLCSPLGILFAKAGTRSLAPLALHGDIHESLFLGPAPLRGHPAQDIRVSSARHSRFPLHSPEPSPPARVPAAGDPWTPVGVDGLLQVPGADTHQHTRQTHLQSCFTFTPFMFALLIGNSWKAMLQFLQQHSQQVK